MIVKIKNIRDGANYEGRTYDYWIFGQLTSGEFIKIFDDGPFDLKLYEGRHINMLIVAAIITDVEHEEEQKSLNRYLSNIKGKYLGNYEIPNNWKKLTDIGDYPPINYIWQKIQYKDGFFLLHPKNLKKISIIDEKVNFNVGRFDLIAWKEV